MLKKFPILIRSQIAPGVFEKVITESNLWNRLTGTADKNSIHYLNTETFSYEEFRKELQIHLKSLLFEYFALESNDIITYKELSPKYGIGNNWHCEIHIITPTEDIAIGTLNSVHNMHHHQIVSLEDLDGKIITDVREFSVKN